MFKDEIKDLLKVEIEGQFDPLITYSADIASSFSKLDDQSKAAEEKIFKEYFPDGLSYIDSTTVAFQHATKGVSASIGAVTEQVYDSYALERELSIRRRLKSEYYFEASLVAELEAQALLDDKLNRLKLLN